MSIEERLHAQATTLRANVPVYLHGPDDAAQDAWEQMADTVDDEPLYAGLVAFLATIAGGGLRSMRRLLPRRLRNKPFAPLVTDAHDTVDLAVGQLVVAAANDDLEMLAALILPWVNGTYTNDDTARLLGQLASYTRLAHQHVCGGCTTP